MKIGGRGKIAIGSAVAVLAIVVYLFSQYWYDIPGLIQSIRDPIQPNQPVQRHERPATAAVPPYQRPPDIVLIFSDDLGDNDITFNGGGGAAGAVPTPNINSIAHEGVAFTNGYAGNATWLEGPIDIDHPLSYLKSARDEYVF